MSISTLQTVMDQIQDPPSAANAPDSISTDLENALNSIARGTNTVEPTEPQIIPFRTKSPPITPRKTMPINGQMDEAAAELPSERGRQEVKGSVILSAT